MGQFTITILGSSGALPALGRFPSSQYLNIQNRHFLIDCGEGTQMQLMRFEVPYHKINHIFISHLHGDHYLGLMGLLFTMHLMRRENDLHIYAFRGLDEIITLQLKQSHSSLNYKLVFHTLQPQAHEVVFEDDSLTVEAFPLTHKIPCNGFLFREKPKPWRIDKTKLHEGFLLQHIATLKSGKDVQDDLGKVLFKREDYTLPPHHSYSYAYCSDTAYDEAIGTYIKNVDGLYHEATFMEADIIKATETRHSTAAQAAKQAKNMQAKKLFLGHFSARYRDLEPLLAEARHIFPNSFLAIEGETIDLEA